MRLAIDFDVDYNYSLEELRKDIEKLGLIPPITTVHFNLWGPGGGNTQVLVYTDNGDELDKVLKFLEKRGDDLSCYNIEED